MPEALWLLAVLGLLGAFDTLYFHEYKGMLPARMPAMRPELKLHAIRDGVYVVIFGTLPWVAWRGWWTAVLAALLVAEVVVTLTDFVTEDRVRKPLGGLYAGERITHALMGIVYGGMLAFLVPVLLRWWAGPTGLALSPAPVPAALRWGLTAAAVGILVSGVRDACAVLDLPPGGWPWQRRTARGPA